MRHRVAIVLGSIAVLVVLLRTAWLCDDAFFTFRTIENLLAGYGPRWNIADRAQAYTHPLWLLLLTPLSAVVGVEPAAYSLGFACSLGTFLALAWGRRWPVVAFVAIALVGSKAWVDFGTSGLENSLTGLLIATLLRLGLSERRRPAAEGLLAGLLVVNRLDLLLIAAGFLLHARRGTPSRSRWALAALPVGLWATFAVVYYGSLLPTTALAKLALGAPRSVLLQHGLWYLVQPLQLDWMTLPVLAVGLVLAVRRHPNLAAAGFLYLAYVAWIGGDFMSGRFHVAPYVLAVGLLVEHVREWDRRPALAVGVGLLALSLISPRSPLLSTPWFGGDRDPTSRPYSVKRGVLDERAFYYPGFGLRSAYPRKQPDPRIERWRVDVGFFGRIPFDKGPLCHQIDPQALGDPFLARMPVPADDLITFRAGHAGHLLPKQYIVSRQHNQNMLTEPSLRALYADVILATQAPIGSRGRGAAVVRLGLHDLRRLIAGRPVVTRESISDPWGG